MSTTFHTAIASDRRPANASTFNSPLGQLDEAIGVVDGRISTIITDPGVSSSEVVDGREDFDVLRDRVRAAYLTANTLLVDAAYPAASTSGKRYQSIAAALSDASAGDTILVAPGTYTGDLVVPFNNIKIVGSGAAGYYPVANVFSTGTVIVGNIDLDGNKHVLISDLTIDVRASAIDGISGGPYEIANSVMQNAEVRNVTIVGNGPLTTAHGIRAESGSGWQIHNLRIYNCAHGIALRSSLANVSDCYIENCGVSGIILKSATVNGSIYGINISNINFFESAGVICEGFDATTYVTDINVVNCYAHYSPISPFIVRQTSGFVVGVTFTNCHSFGSFDNGFHIVAGDRVKFIGCTSNTSIYGFKNDAGSNVEVIGCSSSGASSADTFGSFITLLLNGAFTTSYPTFYYAATLTNIANGAGVGPYVNIGYNNSAGTEAAGHVIMYERDGTQASIWPDASGLLRLGESMQPTSATDGGGTVVGTQTSMAAAKHISDELSPFDVVAERIQAGADAVRRFTYRSGAFGGQEFEGVVIDDAPAYGMDRSEEYPAGRSLNEITIPGDLLRFAAWALARIEALEKKIGG